VAASGGRGRQPNDNREDRTPISPEEGEKFETAITGSRVRG